METCPKNDALAMIENKNFVWKNNQFDYEANKERIAELMLEFSQKQSKFFVVVMQVPEPERVDLEGYRIKRQRTWGYFDTFELAEEYVLNNYTDLFECGYYNLAVIEEMGPGICASATREWWYRAEYTGGGETWHDIQKIEKPPYFEHVCNFGIG